MKAFVITIKDNEYSETAAQRCKDSASFPIETFKAETPNTLTDTMVSKWTYPWNGEEKTIAGLKCAGYRTENKYAVMACFWSHWKLWHNCVAENVNYLVLEHDAIFTQKLNPDELLLDAHGNFGIVAINDPRGATRKSAYYHQYLQQHHDYGLNVTAPPTLDAEPIPHGLPGNSAYIIKPWAAKVMLDLVEEHGAWPNDAIMCKQLHSWLGVSTTYYTTIQSRHSTTTELR